jgi:predicted transcriptional regulator
VAELELRRLRYRSEILVYFEILTVLAEGPTGPTKLSRAVNLPYDRLPQYLDTLLSGGMIRKETRDGHEEYSMTAVGFQLLSDIDRVLSALKPR